MPFLFAWTAMIFIPLIMTTGVIGLIKYLGYYIVQLRARWAQYSAADSGWLYCGHARRRGAVCRHLLRRRAAAVSRYQIHRKIHRCALGDHVHRRRRRDHRILHALSFIDGVRLPRRRVHAEQIVLHGTRRSARARGLRLPWLQHDRLYGRRTARPGSRHPQIHQLFHHRHDGYLSHHEHRHPRRHAVERSRQSQGLHWLGSDGTHLRQSRRDGLHRPDRHHRVRVAVHRSTRRLARSLQRGPRQSLPADVRKTPPAPQFPARSG